MKQPPKPRRKPDRSRRTLRLVKTLNAKLHRISVRTGIDINTFIVEAINKAVAEYDRNAI